jgi:molybdenum cofactor cytidylyltransferase
MFAATILAAGASTRMGSPKALLDYHGKTFLQSILAAIMELRFRCFVVVGHNSDKVLACHDLQNATVVMNRRLEAGPIESIRASIRAMGEHPADALLVWPVDFPHVRVTTVAALVDRFRADDKPAIVAPEHDGFSGHPVIFGRAVYGELLETPDSGGARTVVRHDPTRVARVRVDDPAVVDCVNTPESYRNMLLRTRQ